MDTHTPLSPGQQRLWMLHRLDPTGAAYHVPFAVRFPVGADVPALRAALSAVAGRHEMLRSRYGEDVHGRPYQRVVDDPTVALAVRDITDDWSEHVESLTGIAFDLTIDPPLRATLLRCADGSAVLLVVAHHIVIDGHGVGVVVDDLRAAYAGADLPPLAAGYRDHVAALAARASREGLSYWRTELAGFEPLALPLDRPRATAAPVPEPDHRAGHVRVVLPEDSTTALRTFALRRRSALPAAVAALVQAVLSRWSGQDDVVVGSVLAGRGPAGAHGRLDEVVGFFVNTVVLRARFTPTTTLTELVRASHRSFMAAHEHQDVPFDQVVAAAAPRRDPGRTPIFDVMVAHVGEARGGDPGGRAEIEQVDLQDVTTRFDLEFETRVVRGCLVVDVTYRASLFDHATVQALADGLITLTRRALAAPDVPLTHLPVLDAGRTARVLRESAGAVAADPTTVTEAFAAQARRTPDAVAVVDGDVFLSYAELDRRADALAQRLVAAGVGAEDVVGVLMPRGTELVVALLATLRAGAAYCPLPSTEPVERVRGMLTAAAAAVVLVTAEHADHPVAAALATVVVTPQDPAPTGPPTGRVTDPDRLAYVMYTSGSTGAPKGVAITHGDVVALATDHRFDSGAHDRVLLHSPHTFDAVTYELWVPLLRGGRVVVVPPGIVDVVTIERTVRRAGVTALWLTAGLFRLVADEDPGCLAGVREVWTGGDVVPAGSVRRVLAACPGITVVNGYGPTETTTFATSHAATGRLDGPFPIGRPLDGTTCRVLGPGLQLQPDGVTGELYVAGAGLARGYLGRPDLTADRFVADPWGPPGSRMYRTGDLVRRRGGTIEFVGRADDQVKLRGFRIETGEIESVLATHPGVAQVAVVVREAPQIEGDRRLVAYVVPAGPVPELLTFAAERLPAYMVPAAFVVLAALPLTANGKVDRAALPVPAAPALSAPAARTAGPRESALCTLFAEVLGAPQVGPDDDFFLLGGHSLLAIRLLSRIRSVLGVELSVRSVFEKPTPAGLATELDHGIGARPPVRPRVHTDEIPLSTAQRRLWIVGQSEGPSATYNIPLAVRLRGELDRDALLAAVGDVLTRHEALRTVFPPVHGRPTQRVVDDVDPASVAAVVEVGGHDLVAEVEAAARYAFDLTRELPVRVTLFRISGDDHVLLVLLHHIAGDGASLVPLGEDLAAAYAARLRGQAPHLVPLPVQYADYALWERDLLGDEADPASVLARQVRFWRETLAELPDELALPADRPRPPQTTWRGGTAEFDVPAPLHARLVELSREHRCSLFMTVQAALAATLTRLGAGTDIPIGSPVSGRSDDGLDRLVGFFVNTVVLRTDTGGDPSFAALLDRVRETDLAAFAHQDMPFERLVELVNPPRSLARHPLFQVMLTVQETPDPALELEGITAEGFTVEQPFAKFDLLLSCVVAPGGGLTCGVEYAADLFDEPTAAAFGRRFVQLLEAVSADPRRPIGELELLTPAERHDLLHGVNATDADVPETTLPALFAAQARRTPQSEALVFEGRSLTYAELDDRVQRLALALGARGVGPETVVGVHAPRSVELVVALHAVHRAGGAYLPLDPDYPAERLEYMVADARPVLVLTVESVREMLAETHPGVELVAPVPENLAYLIYTSGSTGRPKGVAVPHRAIVNRLLWGQAQYGLTPTDRVLQKTPASFDVSVWEFFWPLITGATLVVARPDGHREPHYLIELINAERITTVHFVPSMLRAFLAEPGMASCTGVRRVLCSGEALTPDLRTQLLARLDTELHNLYGPTETGVEVSHWPCTAGQTGPVPIGFPVWNTRLHVLDAALRPVPVGVAGELYIAGVQLARGYAGRPDLTADRFVADPYGPPGSRMYRSGDLARRRRDGAVEYLARVDHQVKIRGLRIELDEVEAVLGGHDEVREAVVLARTDDAGTAFLVAYLVPVGGRDEERDEERYVAAVRTAALRRLPDYMVPTAVVLLDALPLTPSGKLDRKALPEPRRRAAVTVTGPRTPQEEMLATLFAEALGVPEVGVDEDFFRLGGHSLLGIALISRIRAVFGVTSSIRTLFEAPTVAAFAQHLGADVELDPLAPLLPLRVRGEQPPLFCLAPAAGIGWSYSGLLRHLDEDRPVYALQDPTLSGAAPATMDDLVRHHVGRIRSVQPTGPYHLLGWSFGGLLAHAVATALQESGERVALLALVDAYPLHGRPRPPAPTEAERLAEVLESLGHRAELPAGRTLGVREFVATLRAADGSLAGLADDRLAAVADTFAANVGHGDEHVPGVVDGDVLLFTATRGRERGAPGPADWAPHMTGELAVRRVPAAHGELMGRGALSLIGPVVAAHLPAPDTLASDVPEPDTRLGTDVRTEHLEHR